jgi:hypothetical protein
MPPAAASRTATVADEGHTPVWAACGHQINAVMAVVMDLFYPLGFIEPFCDCGELDPPIGVRWIESFYG